MKLRYLAAGALAALMTVGPAAASFNGPYVGVSLGAGMSGKDRYSACAVDCNGGSGASPLFFPAAASGFQQSFSGFAWNAHIGANKVFSPMMGPVMLGLEVSGGSGNFSVTSTNPFGALTVGAVATYNTKVRWVSTITPRVGMIWGGNLLYLKAGAAFGGVSSNLSNTGGTWGARSFSEKSTHSGYTFGVGWENEAWAPWVWGIAYDYIDLGRQHYGGTVSPSTTWPLDYTVKTRFGELTGRLSVRF